MNARMKVSEPGFRRPRPQERRLHGIAERLGLCIGATSRPLIVWHCCRFHRLALEVVQRPDQNSQPCRASPAHAAAMRAAGWRPSSPPSSSSGSGSPWR